MKGDHEFKLLGAVHFAQGHPRYRFQDPHLQKLYNEGYDNAHELREAVEQHMARRQVINRRTW